MTVFGIDLGRSAARLAWPAGGPGAATGTAGSVAVPAAVRFAGPDETLVGEDALRPPAGPASPAGPAGAADAAQVFVPSVRDLLVRSAEAADADVRAFERTYSPESVAALVLAELATRARAATAGQVRDVVLATPTGFGVGPGAAQRRAAEEAGLAVKGTVLAPVAVCLHYGAVGEGVNQNLVVCDVGAGGREISALLVREYLVDLVPVPHLAEDLVAAVRAAGAAIGGPDLDDLDAVLLAGDGATEDVAVRLEEALGVPVRRAEPETAVANGAARSASFGFLRVNTSGAPTSSPRPDTYQSPVADVDDPEPATSRRPPASFEQRIGRTSPPAPPPYEEPPASSSSSPPPRAETVLPPRTEHVPPRATSSAPADTGPARPQPVAALHAVRREDHALLTWIWPPDCVNSVVRWRIGTSDDGRSGETVCSRRVYEHEGGFLLRVGLTESLFTVEALVPGAHPDPGPPSSVALAALPPTVRYALTVTRGRRRTGRVTLTADTDCSFPTIDVVLSEGRYLPRGAHEGEVVHRIAGARLAQRTPLTVEFPVPRFRGPAWLVCFPADPADSLVELLPESLHRLKVG
ncbi:Hsp70 family protein [Catenulispora subtropica]|uniref:Molecular chaperone-like protein n=1 Tax=Catenulispora subtropica TaxID=450798 RepID=A0ABN2R0A2_9ACTN